MFPRSRSSSMMSVTVGSSLMANSPHSANGDHFAGVPDTQYVVVQQPDACNSIFANNPKMGVSEIQEIAKKLEEMQLKYSEKCALNIKVVDDTALIETPVIGKGKFNRNSQEIGKEKKRKRRGGKGRNKKKNADVCIQNHASVGKKEVYSRAEMEALRFENLQDQKKKWAAVYCGLGGVAAEEYDGLVAPANVDKKRTVSSFGFDRRPFFKKSANLDAVGRRNHLNIFVH